jgi:serine protease Do
MRYYGSMLNKSLSKTIGIIVAVGFAAGLLGGLLSSAITGRDSSQESITGLNEVARATVTIRARTSVGEGQTNEHIGIGVVVHDGGYIVTNDHIVDGSQQIFVKVNSGKELEANIVKQDRQNDMAVIRVSDANLTSPSFGKNADIKVGSRVYALGKPFLNSDNYTVTSGVISSLPVNLPKGSPHLLQTDAAINPGNSGGPLIDGSGKVVAINTAYMSTGENVAGIGFSIPIDEVLKFADTAINNSQNK